MIPTPHPGQLPILESRERYTIAICGRRFGKTTAGLIAALRHAAATPKALIWWIAPSMQQAQRSERTAAAWISASEKTWKWDRSEKAITHERTAARIEFHTASEPDNLRGAGVSFMILDEAAVISQYAWKYVLRPMLADKADSRALFLTTPKGTRNWIHEIFQRAVNKQDGYASIHAPTTANPHVSKAALDDLKADMTPEEWAQEFEAQFITSLTRFFIDPAWCEGEPPPRPYRASIGIDLARARDWTAIAIIDALGRCSVARYRWPTWNDTIHGILKETAALTGPMLVDSTGVGDPVAEALSRHRETRPFIISQVRRQQLLDRLALAISRRAVSFYPSPAFKHELESFEWVNSETGPPRPDAPPGGSDDMIFAAALATWNLDAGAIGPNALNAFTRGLYA
jgi:hypothetical protein